MIDSAMIKIKLSRSIIEFLAFDVGCFKCNEPDLTVCYISSFYLVDINYSKIIILSDPVFRSGHGIITHYATELSGVVK